MSSRRWLVLALLAIVLHLGVATMLGLLSSSSVPIRVISMTPVPNASVNVDGGRLRIDLRLSAPADEHAINPLGARLLRLDDAGGADVVAFATLDPEDPRHLIFETERVEGRYRVWLAAGGSQPLFTGEAGLDGEYLDRFPTGNGRAGGDFTADFVVQETPLVPDRLVAKIIEEEPPEESSMAAASMPQQEAPSAPPPPTPVDPPPQPKPTPPPPTKKRVNNTPPPKPELAPMELEPLDEADFMAGDPPPQPEAPLDLRPPTTIAEDITADASKAFGEQVRQERVENGILGDFQGEIEADKEAMSGEGSKVQPGNQQAVRTHTKEVWAYIALIHKHIHRKWANEYLLHLDLVASAGDPLNNPNLHAVIELEIRPDGKIKTRLVRTSGVYAYDREALSIARNAGINKPTPVNIRSPDGNVYIHWNFWRDQRQCGTFGVSVYVLNDDGERNKFKIDEQKLQREEERLGIHKGPHHHHHHGPGHDEDDLEQETEVVEVPAGEAPPPGTMLRPGPSARPPASAKPASTGRGTRKARSAKTARGRTPTGKATSRTAKGKASGGTSSETSPPPRRVVPPPPRPANGKRVTRPARSPKWRNRRRP